MVPSPRGRGQRAPLRDRRGLDPHPVDPRARLELAESISAWFITHTPLAALLLLLVLAGRDADLLALGRDGLLGRALLHLLLVHQSIYFGEDVLEGDVDAGGVQRRRLDEGEVVLLREGHRFARLDGALRF